MPWRGDYGPREPPSCPRLMASAQTPGATEAKHTPTLAVAPLPDRSAAMDEDAVVLTSYFRQRHRTDVGLLGDALIGLYERRPVAASVLLRGVSTEPLVGTVVGEVAGLTRPLKGLSVKYAARRDLPGHCRLPG
jgi:hypothetical protein